MRTNKERLKISRDRHRRKHLKEEATRVAKWRDDKHRGKIEFWTKMNKLLDKNPIVIDNPFDLDLQFKKWDFDKRPIIASYKCNNQTDEIELRIARQDGYGGTILYTGTDAKRLFGRLL